ncbi:MAG TPA: M56 family metallopeptidase [Longimicrobiaceae bacterium]|nr:M56 family metallopeptidase [Longimicrobiaceae bacterium]
MIAEQLAAAGGIPALLLGWALTYLVHSTLLLGGLWLLTSRGVGSWAVRDTLWKVAVVGGILTATIQTAAAWAPGAGPPATVAAGSLSGGGEGSRGVALSPEPGSPAAAGVPDGSGPRLALPRGYRLQVHLDGEPASASTGADGRVRVRWTVWFLAAWALGAGLGLAAMVRARVRLRRLLRSRSPVADPSLRAMLSDLCRQSGVRRTVRLTTTDRLRTPFAMGTREICLPARALRRLDREQQRSVLAHELAHLLRRDPWWFTCLAVIERVLFFQPLLRLARREIQEGAELLCDDWAARQVGGLELARCIAEIASWSAAPPQALAMARMAGSGPLTRRVDRLLAPSAVTDRPRSRVWAGLAGGLATLAVACAPGVSVRTVGSDAAVHVQDEGGAEVEAPANAAAEGAEAVQPAETLEATVTVEADGTIVYSTGAVDEPRMVVWAHGPFWQSQEQLQGRIRLETQGRIRFSADGTEIVELSKGARFVVEETDTSGVRRLEVFRGEDDGVRYAYSVDGRPEPWRQTREQTRWLGPLTRELLRVSTPEARAAL